MDQFNQTVNKYISSLKTNDVLNGVLVLFLVLYAGIAAPSLPAPVLKLFDYAAFRVSVLALIMWNNNGNPALSLSLAMAFIASMNTLSGKQLFEKFELIEPQGHILPGCLQIKLADLLKAFDDDEAALKKALIHVGTPFNIPFNDENAPLLATHLINFGYKLSDTCQLPAGTMINE